MASVGVPAALLRRSRRADAALPVVVALLAAVAPIGGTACRGADDVPRAYPAAETPGASSRVVAGGRPDRGAAALVAYGCGTCHVIPGVRGARGLVGPPLAGMAARTFVAGVLPNDAPHLIGWIRHPEAVRPRTAMPNLGVTEPDARDMAAYLYTLEGPGRR